MGELFAIDRDSPDYNEGERRGVFYAQSWALVHYMLNDDDRRRRIVEFLNRSASGEPMDTAFENAFGTDYKTVEDGLRGYIEQRVFSYKKIEASIPPESQATVEPLERAELLYRLGNLLSVMENREADALKHFQAALELAPGHARSIAGIGYLAEQAGDWNRAREIYARAAVKASDDFLIHFFYGRSLLPINGGQDALLSRQHLERSLQLKPDFPETWASLTLTYFDGSMIEVPPRALQVAQTAHRLQPSRTDIAFNLLSLYSLAREREAATALSEGYFRARGDAEDLTRARYMVAEIDLREADAFGRARKYQQALESLERYEAATQPTQRIDWFPSFAEDLREAAAYQRFSEGYDAASKSYNAQDYQAVIDQLEALLPDAPDDDWRESVESLLRLARFELEKQGG